MEIPIPLIIACLVIILILIVLPLIISHKAERQEQLNEWDKIKEYGNKINNKTRKNK